MSEKRATETISIEVKSIDSAGYETHFIEEVEVSFKYFCCDWCDFKVKVNTAGFDGGFKTKSGDKLDEDFIGYLGYAGAYSGDEGDFFEIEDAHTQLNRFENPDGDTEPDYHVCKKCYKEKILAIGRGLK